MLHLWLGKKVTDPELIFLPSLFEGFCKSEWFDDADIQQAISNIDHNTQYYGKMRWESPWLGVIGPGDLSGGVQTLITAYYDQSKVFPLSYLGDNCAESLMSLSNKRDMYFTMGNYIFQFLDGHIIYVENFKSLVNGYNLIDEIIERGFSDAIRESVFCPDEFSEL